MIKTERSKFTLIMTVAAVAAGFVLRLSYPLDIEFKADERWTFEQVRAALSGGPWWGRRGNIGSFLFALLSALAAQIARRRSPITTQHAIRRGRGAWHPAGSAVDT